ncbi:MAG: MOSC domain-containing protein, partial [Alphaproteobacteria bacterium]|nr:MOSC domain-containing protein [Alphaproteobacteria bacterium]
AIPAFFKPFLGSGAASAPDLAHAPGHTFSDKPAKVVSLINLASVDALSKVVGRTVDPLRFRANIYFQGAPAWAEFEWLGRN